MTLALGERREVRRRATVLEREVLGPVLLGARRDGARVGWARQVAPRRYPWRQICRVVTDLPLRPLAVRPGAVDSACLDGHNGRFFTGFVGSWPVRASKNRSA